MEKNATASLADGASGERVSSETAGREPLRAKVVPRPPLTAVPQDALETIVRLVCERFGCQRSQFFSKDRMQYVADARHVAVYLLRTRLMWSYPRIGKAVGFRNHTTAISAMRKIERLTANDPEWREAVSRLNAELGAP